MEVDVARDQVAEAGDPEPRRRMEDVRPTIFAAVSG
jgi:hypothetical protein